MTHDAQLAQHQCRPDSQPAGIAGLLPVAQPDLTQIAGDSVSSGGSLWDNGEWWMLLAAQSMALGTIMVRWVSKHVSAYHLLYDACMTSHQQFLLTVKGKHLAH